jgi:hypothetical protein
MGRVDMTASPTARASVQPVTPRGPDHVNAYMRLLGSTTNKSSTRGCNPDRRAGLTHSHPSWYVLFSISKRNPSRPTRVNVYNHQSPWSNKSSKKLTKPPRLIRGRRRTVPTFHAAVLMDCAQQPWRLHRLNKADQSFPLDLKRRDFRPSGEPQSPGVYTAETTANAVLDRSVTL